MNKLETTRKSKLYVGCALTHAPMNFKESVEDIKRNLESDWEVMKFLGLADGTSGDVYEQDIERNVRNCDAFLAIADHPASGLEWELGAADERAIPTLIVAQFGAKVTRLLIGAADVREHITFVSYGTIEEIPALVENYLRPMVR